MKHIVISQFVKGMFLSDGSFGLLLDGEAVMEIG